MIDPNNVLIRCPNNHELQAAKTDLNRPLVCPVCNVTFTPAGSISAPTTLAYAPMTEAVKYPGYTNWMLGLWVTVIALSLVSSIASSFLIKPTTATPQGTIPGAMGYIFVGCGVLIALTTAIVMQLMWIYRIHRDARNGGGYDRISPGLALGLTFIPFFNYLWTGVAIKKLAAFADERSSQMATNQVTPIANICMLFGIIVLLTNCTSLSITGSAWLKVLPDMQAAGSSGMSSPAMQQKIMASMPSWLPMWDIVEKIISLVAVIVYFKTVRKLENVLYPALGALPK